MPEHLSNNRVFVFFGTIDCSTLKAAFPLMAAKDSIAHAASESRLCISFVARV